MIGTITVKVNSKNPNIPLCPLYAFVNSPSSLRILDVPKRIGLWNIDKVYVTTSYPDNSTKSTQCKLVGGAYVGTIDGSQATGKSVNGYSITADGTDENGDAVAGYVLGKGDVFILSNDGQITVGETTYYLHLLSAEPVSCRIGDTCEISGSLKYWNGTEWKSFGGTSSVSWGHISGDLSNQVDLTAAISTSRDYVDQQLSSRRNLTDLSVYQPLFTDFEAEPLVPSPDYYIKWDDSQSKWGIWCSFIAGYCSNMKSQQADSLRVSWTADEWSGGYDITFTRQQAGLSTYDMIAKVSQVPVFNDAQMSAVNSGIDATKVSQIQDNTYAINTLNISRRDKTDLAVWNNTYSNWQSDPELRHGQSLRYNNASGHWGIYQFNVQYERHELISREKGSIDSTEIEFAASDWSGNYDITFNRSWIGYAQVDTLATSSDVSSKAETSTVYLKSQLSTVNLSGEYVEGGEFNISVLTLI